MAQALLAAGGPVLGTSAIWRACERLGWKRKSVHAAERDTERVVALRKEVVEALAREYFTHFVFVDETSANLPYCRRYGRAPDGKRLPQAVPLHNGPNVTGLAALTPDGLGALCSVNGAGNGNVFAAYLDQVLGPPPPPGAVVVLDNLSVHKVAGLDEVAHSYGARRHLSPDSPDFKPITLAFSKLKPWLRTAQARTRGLLEDAMRAAAEWLTEADAKNWFAHCGSHVH